MPTGWEVTLDLVRKLAVLQNETSEPDPERWYQNKFGVSPDYSDLLEQLAKTPAERQQLLRQYWEPSAEERQEKKKTPTAAHRALASLASRGFIRIFVTTNFDGLIETALADAGVNATVLSSADQVHGALPLVHTQCCVLKVNGDYRDARIRNTESELDKYPPEFDDLLDRVFDEFGLIVCGWSAEWDHALRKAISRTPSRRFSMYWAVRGKLSAEADKLTRDRGAAIVQIEDADSFFQSLRQSVGAIDEFARPHPLSTEAAVASLKRYLPETRHRIRLQDLVRRVVSEAVELTSEKNMSMNDGVPCSSASITTRLRNYDTACSTLLAMATVAGEWIEEGHWPVLRESLQRLGRQDWASPMTLWHELRRYPASLCLYALCIGAVHAGRLRFVEHMLSTELHSDVKGIAVAAQVLPPFRLFYYSDGRQMRKLEGMNTWTPLSAWIHDVLRPYTEAIIPIDEQHTFCFDKFEILLALNYMRRAPREPGQEWCPLGAFSCRPENREAILEEITKSVAKRGDESPFAKCGLIGETGSACEEAVELFRECVSKLTANLWE